MGIALTFPEHKCGLFLSHNEHRGYYQKLPEFIEDSNMADDFESPEAMNRSIETDECWVLQWYPDTPVGFIRVAAPTLDECLELANSGERGK